MKIFTKKSIIHKIAFVLIILFLFNFIIPNLSHADDDGLGGALLNPILDLLVAIGDGIMWLIQNAIFGIKDSLIHIDFGGSWWQWALVIGGAILAAVAAAAALIATAGAASAIIAAIGAEIAVSLSATTIIMVAGGAGLAAGYFISKDVLPDDYYLPMYRISPYMIFSNQIPTFDVNFFNPSDDKYVDENGNFVNENETKTEKSQIGSSSNSGCNLSMTAEKIANEAVKSYISDPEPDYINPGSGEEPIANTYRDDSSVAPAEYGGYYETMQHYSVIYRPSDKATYAVHIDMKRHYSNGYRSINDEGLTDSSYTMSYEYKVYKTGKSIPIVIKSTAGQLSNVVSGWYYTLRNLALIGLLSVLVYVGIRIVISSTANEKAKYKSMIMDWVIAMCLLFFLHYIMAFSVTLVAKLTEALTGLNNSSYISVIEDKDNKIRDAMKEKDSTLSKFKDLYSNSKGKKVDPTSSNAKDGTLRWETNEIGYARMQLQLKGAKREGSDESAGQSLMSEVSYTIIFLCLIAYTLIFTFTYLKRVLYMAFLTLIAPLVALTYPIDKLNDGKAQAFNTWFKEYIFNLLIQPMHLILYTILIGTAFTFASQNLLYVIVALGFMVPAEKLMRRFFGFEKAHTPGAFAGPAGAALMMTGINKMFHKPPRRPEDDENDGSSRGNRTNNRIRSSEQINPMQTIADRNNNNNNSIDNGIQRNILPQGNDATEGEDNLPQNNSGNNEPIRYFTGDIGNQNSVDNPNTPSNLSEGDTEKTDNPIRFNIPDNETQEQISMSNQPKATQRQIKSPNGGNNKRFRDHIKDSFKNTGRGLNNMRYHYSRKLANRVRKSHPVRTLRRATTAAAGAAAVGTLGLVAGITSGDPSKAMQYAAAGALAGGKFSKAAGEKIAASSKGGSKAFKQGYLGNQYLQKEQEKLMKEFSRDQKNVDYLMERGYSPKQIRTVLNDVAPQYLNEGITDMDDILTGYKLEQGDPENGFDSMDRNEAISTIKMANRMGDTRKSAKADKEWEERLTREYNTIPEVQRQQAQEQAREQARIEAEYQKEVEELNRKKMTKARREKGMEEAKARRDALMNNTPTDTAARKIANDTIARARRVYDIKDNI